MNYLIDTNILVIYVRDTALTRRLEQDLRLLAGDNNLVISVVSIGEIKSIAKQNKWGEKRGSLTIFAKMLKKVKFLFKRSPEQ